jgi:hypothetical protein
MLLERMPSPFRETAKLATLALMREGEIRTLKREMVHFGAGRGAPTTSEGRRAPVLGVPEPGGRALQPGPREPGLPQGSARGRAQGLPLP